MSIFSSLFIGMSGLRVNEASLSVVGDNLANMNTVGYKASRGVFADVFHHTVLGSGGADQMGNGAQVVDSQRVHNQGAMLGTSVSTDMAIGGNGFFIVKGSVDGREGLSYTRNGQLRFDDQGFLSTIDGLRLQGFAANTTGEIGSTLADLQVANAVSLPQATSAIELGVTLDSKATINAAFDPLNPEATSSHSTTVGIIDSLGNRHQVEIYYNKTADNTWEWHVVLDEGELEGGTPGTLVEQASGELRFNPDGTLELQNTIIPFNVQFAGGANAQTIELDFGDPTLDGGDGGGSAQFAGPSANSSISQDGFEAGTFQFLTVDAEGTLMGTFSNGQQRALGQLALATFSNDSGLESVGNNLLRETFASGQAAIGAATTDGKGQVIGGALEQSNVDLSNEFTKLIMSQRGFQASSRTITTADAMLSELVNLKR